VQQLKDAGVETSYVTLNTIHQFYEPYLHWKTTGQCFVHLKMAMSLDGKIAEHAKHRTQISGAAEFRYTMQQRLHSDALLTTVETINIDDPQFNVRLQDLVIDKPVIILDRLLSLSENARVLKSNSRLIVLHSEQADVEKIKAWREKKVECRCVTMQDGHLDVIHIKKILGSLGYHSIWLECGQRLASAWMQKKQVDALSLYGSPSWLGNNAYSAFDTVQNILKEYVCIKTVAQGNASIMLFKPQIF